MKASNIILSILFMLVSCVSGYFLLPAYTKYRKSQENLKQVISNEAELDHNIASVDKKIHALEHDDRAIERVAREKFGWCRDGEQVYRIQTPEPRERTYSELD